MKVLVERVSTRKIADRLAQRLSQRFHVKVTVTSGWGGGGIVVTGGNYSLQVTDDDYRSLEAVNQFAEVQSYVQGYLAYASDAMLGRDWT